MKASKKTSFLDSWNISTLWIAWSFSNLVRQEILFQVRAYTTQITILRNISRNIVLHFLAKIKLPSVCLLFFNLSVHFILKWVQRGKFLFTMWFHNFLYNFWSKITWLYEWITSSWSTMFKNVGFLWWRALASARYE